MREVLATILLIISIAVVSRAFQEKADIHPVGMDRLYDDTQGIRDRVPPGGNIALVTVETDSAASLRFCLMLRYVLAPRVLLPAPATCDTALYVFERMGTEEEYQEWASRRKVLYVKRTGSGAFILTCQNR